MKRDMDLIRKILLHVEQHDDLQFVIEGYSEQQIAYHVRLLVEAELLHAVAQPASVATLSYKTAATHALPGKAMSSWRPAAMRVCGPRPSRLLGLMGGMVLDVLKSVLIGLATDAAKKPQGSRDTTRRKRR